LEIPRRASTEILGHYASSPCRIFSRHAALLIDWIDIMSTTINFAIVDAFAVTRESDTNGLEAPKTAARLVPVNLTPEIIAAVERAIQDALDDPDSAKDGNLAIYKSTLDPDVVHVSGLVTARNGFDPCPCPTLFNAVAVRDTGKNRGTDLPVGCTFSTNDVIFSQLAPHARQ
jgi:hypothetical protein